MNKPPDSDGTLLLSRQEIADLVSLTDCIEVVEEAFRAHALGKSLGTGILHMDAPDGEFHIKSGGLSDPSLYFALKANAGFFKNSERFGLPNIQGLILLYSAENGYPLAVLDSLGITAKRTGAATAVAAKYLARPESSAVALIGCGTQARVQLRALKEVLPLTKVFAFSIADGEADQYAAEMSAELGIAAEAVESIDAAVAECDICVTCTPARKAFLHWSYVRPGTFVAAVGADSPDKQELETAILANSKVVVDLLEQARDVGELHHAIAAGSMKESDVFAELGQIVAGNIEGRTSESEVIVFDSTGTALQDTAAAILAYEKALERGVGSHFDFGATP